MTNFTPVLPFGEANSIGSQQPQQVVPFTEGNSIPLQQPHQVDDVTLTTLTFAPGEVGLKVAWNAGRDVTELKPDGQAQAKGVQIGWTVEAVNGRHPDLQTLSDFVEGSSEYQITFSTKAVESIMVVTFTFTPGSIGITARWITGEVLAIIPAGQGDRHGVEVGMRFHKIDGAPYSEALLDSKIVGDEDYEISFKKAIDVKETALEIPGCAEFRLPPKASRRRCRCRCFGRRQEDEETRAAEVQELKQARIFEARSKLMKQRSSFDPRTDSVVSGEKPTISGRLWWEGFGLLIMAGIDNICAYVTYFTVRAFHGRLYNIVDLHFTLLVGIDVALIIFAALGTFTFVMMIVLVECLKLSVFHELMNFRLLFSALPNGIICGVLLYHSERTEWAPFATVIAVLCTIFAWCLHMRVTYVASLNVLSKVSLDVSWFLAGVCVTILAILFVADELKIITNSESLHCPYAANDRMPVFAVPLNRWYCAPWDEDEPMHLERAPINNVPVELTCSDTFISIFGMSIEPHLIFCPSGCLRNFVAHQGFNVVGCGIYTIDSPICVAAIHAGELTDAGGQATVYGRLGVSLFRRCSRNSVTSIERYVTQTGTGVTTPQSVAAAGGRRLLTVPAVYGPGGQEIPQAFHFNNDQPGGLPQTKEFIWLKTYKDEEEVVSSEGETGQVQADKPWTRIQSTMSLRIAGIELNDEKVRLGETPIQPLFLSAKVGQVFDGKPPECYISESGVICDRVSSAVVQLDFCRTEVKQCT